MVSKTSCRFSGAGGAEWRKEGKYEEEEEEERNGEIREERNDERVVVG